MTSPPQKFHFSVRDGILVLEIKDAVLNDHEQAQRIRDELLVAVTDASCDVVLDLRNVEYLTSVALLPFVEVRSAAESHGKRVVLCNLADVVAKVLTVSQLIVESSHGRYLEMADDVESAIRLLKAAN